jgi:tape measure domain-containing protein
MEGGGKRMSQTIDKKIVQMDFENEKFEKGVATSMGTLDKLKNSLKFDKTVDAFSGITNAAKGLNLSSLLDGLSTAQVGFLSLAAIGVAQLNRLVSAAVDAGVRIAKALTVDPIRTGLEEYETKLNSVQTILANTQKEGTTLDTVTTALNELNEYADKTIYNFKEMTRNVGTFTAAGVKLQTSVDAIKGIANLAAISGSNAQQASTAMYQLSQALSTGTVKLMDWNSVVNAGMGGQVFQEAIKETARLHGVAIDQMIEEEGSFRDSLQKGWFTSEILTETLAKFTGDLNEDQLRTMGYTEEQIKAIIKMGQTASDAATKVKTFTQLYDTLKEAAQSGWAQTWEVIIGDFEEAKAFLTELNDILGAMIGASAETRNNLLKGWKELGGRDDLLESVRNMLDAILSFVKPISEAMEEIFPPITVKQLVALTEGLKEFTKGLKLTENGASTLKRIFKGVFALFDIVWYGITSLTKALLGFSIELAPTAVKLIDFIANIADFIVNLRDAIRDADGFGEVIEVIRKVLVSGGSAFKKFFGIILNGLKNLKGINLDGLTSFIDKMKTKFKPLTAIGTAFMKVINFLKLALQKIAPIAVRLAEIVSVSVSTFMDKITVALGKFEPERIITLINGGLLSGVLLAIRKFVSKGSGMFDGVTDILDSVKGSLEAWQGSLKADTLIKIAAALGIMALSILLLATIDKDKLAGALLAMTAMFVQLGVSLAAFEKISSTANPVQMSTMAIGLIAISSAMLIMALAVRTLGSMDSQELVKGMLAIVSMIGVLSLSAKTLSNNSGNMITGALALIVFSFAIRSLSKAVMTLGSMDTVDLAKGLTGVGVLITELALFMKSMNLGGLALTNVLGILVLAGAIAVLVNSVEKLSEINGESLFKALTAIGVILAELSLFVYATAGGTTLLLTAAGIAVMSVAMLALTESIERLGAMSWEQVAIGLTAMAGALVLIGAASYLMPPTMLTQAAGLIVMGSALVIIADALKIMGSMNSEELGASLIVLGGSLLILTIALNAMTSALPGAAALFVAALGLMALAPALKILGSMSWEEIGRGLVALAGTFLILGVAGALMTPVIPTLLGLGGAMLLVGAGMALAGVGLLAFSAGLAALSVSGAAGASALVIVISSIVGLVPMIVATLGRAILALVDVLVEGAPKLLEGIVVLLNILLDGLIEVVPKVVDVVVLLIEKLLTALAEKMPTIIQAGYDILKGFLSGVRDNIGEVVSISVDVINAYLTAIADKIPDIVDSGWNLIISWVDGMKAGVGEHLPELMVAVQDLGIEIVKGLAKGMIDGRNNAVDAVKELAKIVIDEFKHILGINSPSTVFIEFATNIIAGLVNGFKTNASKVVGVVADIAIKIVDSLKNRASNMIAAGSDLVSGFAKGIRTYIGDAVKAATELAMSTLTAIKKTLGINSPAKELIEVGKYADEGLAGGITKFSRVVLSSIGDLGKNAVSEFSNVIGRISEVVNSDIDFVPTIRPVVDISDVERGSNEIRRLFGDLDGGGLSPSLSFNKAKSISIDDTGSNSPVKDNANGEVKEVTFIQNNNSPKALSPVEIYRSTKNLLSRTQKPVGTS